VSSALDLEIFPAEPLWAAPDRHGGAMPFYMLCSPFSFSLRVYSTEELQTCPFCTAALTTQGQDQ